MGERASATRLDPRKDAPSLAIAHGQAATGIAFDILELPAWWTGRFFPIANGPNTSRAPVAPQKSVFCSQTEKAYSRRRRFPTWRCGRPAGDSWGHLPQRSIMVVPFHASISGLPTTRPHKCYDCATPGALGQFFDGLTQDARPRARTDVKRDARVGLIRWHGTVPKSLRSCLFSRCRESSAFSW